MPLPHNVSLDSDVQERQEMFLQNLGRLKHLVWLIMEQQKISNTKFILVSIQVCDFWHELVSELSLDDTFRHNNPFSNKLISSTVVTGAYDAELCRHIAYMLPMASTGLLTPPMKGSVKCVVLNESGCTLHNLRLGLDL